MKERNWSRAEKITPKGYVCALCASKVGSELGWRCNIIEGEQGNPKVVAHCYIYVCPHCYAPTYFDETLKQIPGTIFGEKISNIPEKKIEMLYDEARNAMSVNSFTAAVMCCRKLLMNIAVDKGAQAGQPFESYVKYLDDENFIPKGSKGWVSFIREKGNEANHEIQIMNKVDAEKIIKFVEMLLKIIYEYPAVAQPNQP